MVSALYLGRRKGFLERHAEFPPSSLPMACVGGGLLWMGWFGFNAGSVFQASSSTALVIANTQLASATSMMVWVLVAWHRGRPHAADALNGAIAGLAGITPASGYISPWAAFLLGIILGLASFYGVRLLRFKLHIDDALDVSSVHGITGIIGSLAIGFATQTKISGTSNDGIFFGRHSAYLLGVQVLAVVVVASYTALITWALLAIISRFGPIALQTVRTKTGEFDWYLFFTNARLYRIQSTRDSINVIMLSRHTIIIHRYFSPQTRWVNSMRMTVCPTMSPYCNCDFFFSRGSAVSTILLN